MGARGAFRCKQGISTFEFLIWLEEKVALNEGIRGETCVVSSRKITFGIPPAMAVTRRNVLPREAK